MFSILSYKLRKRKVWNNMFDNFKSPETLNSKTRIRYDEIINSNLLYITHEIDQIKKIVIEILNSTKLQKQVDDFFPDERTSEHIPEE